jgi:hypothetical protein
MTTWITRPPNDDWHVVDRDAPGPPTGRSLLLAMCGRSFLSESREHRLQTQLDRVPERRRCPLCQGAYLKPTLPA